MAGAGRPAKDRGIFAFEALLLPDRLVLDTSFVAEALLSGQPRHQEASGFLARLAEHGSVLVFNRLLELELTEVAFRIAIKEQHGSGRWTKLRHDGRVRRRASRLTDEALASWQEGLAAFTYEVFELEAALPAVPGLMAAYGLSSYDAVHAASAFLSQEVPAIATLDGDFAALPEDVQIHTASARVGRMRRYRGGHAKI